jgi:hypothetical protein
MGVKAAFTSVYYPHSNRAVERANALIFSAIKKILEDHLKGKWQKSYWGLYGATTLPSPAERISHLSSYCTVRSLPIKKILENQPKGKWAEELPRVVWSHNTSVPRGTNFTPFKLSYGEEPVTSEEIKLRSSRTRSEAIYSPTEAKSNDLLEPEQIKAVDNLQSYQNEMRAWRDKKVKQKSIKVGDLVLLRSPRTVASIKLESK